MQTVIWLIYLTTLWQTMEHYFLSRGILSDLDEWSNKDV